MKNHLSLRANIALGLIFAFLANFIGPLPAFAQESFFLPAPGQMVALSPAFDPAVLKGIKLDPQDPFRFHFFVDKGDSNLSQDELKSESSKLIKYFLASLTIPEQDLWVNLSPYEKNRIVPQEFGQTEMGRDLLAEDYILKQITASLIYPESQLGKEFWQKVYAQAQAKYGTTNIPINTFNKVWIVPDKAVVYENGGTAFVLENHLKVMLEEDYLSLQKHQGQPGDMASAVSPSALPSEVGLDMKAPQVNNQSTNALGSQIIREIVIPQLEHEVNYGKNFSQLRQVFYSLILATWYKKKIKDSIFNKVYSNRKKIQNLSTPNVLIGDPQHIYQLYLQAFKKGVFNYIKDTDTPNGVSGPRKYFSGGITCFVNTALTIVGKGRINAAMSVLKPLHMLNLEVDFLLMPGEKPHPSAAMKSKSTYHLNGNDKDVLEGILSTQPRKILNVMVKYLDQDNILQKTAFDKINDKIYEFNDPAPIRENSLDFDPMRGVEVKMFNGKTTNVTLSYNVLTIESETLDQIQIDRLGHDLIATFTPKVAMDSQVEDEAMNSDIWKNTPDLFQFTGQEFYRALTMREWKELKETGKLTVEEGTQFEKTIGPQVEFHQKQEGYSGYIFKFTRRGLFYGHTGNNDPQIRAVVRHTISKEDIKVSSDGKNWFNIDDAMMTQEQFLARFKPVPIDPVGLLVRVMGINEGLYQEIFKEGFKPVSIRKDQKQVSSSLYQHNVSFSLSEDNRFSSTAIDLFAFARRYDHDRVVFILDPEKVKANRGKFQLVGAWFDTENDSRRTIEEGIKKLGFNENQIHIKKGALVDEIQYKYDQIAPSDLIGAIIVHPDKYDEIVKWNAQLGLKNLKVYAVNPFSRGYEVYEPVDKTTIAYASQEETQKIYRSVFDSASEGMSLYLGKFTEAIKSVPGFHYIYDDTVVPPQWTKEFWQGYTIKLERILAQNVVKTTTEGSEEYWLLKHRRNDDKNSPNSNENEKLTYLIGKQVGANFTQARDLTPQEYEELQLSGDISDYYLDRIVSDDDWRNHKILQTDRPSAFCYNLVMSLYLSKIGHSIRNTGFIHGVPFEIDDENLDFGENDNDFLLIFLINHILNTATQIKSLRQVIRGSIDTLMSDILHRRLSRLKNVGQMVRKFSLGEGVIGAEGLNKEGITDAIKKIKQMSSREIIGYVHQAGFSQEHFVAFQLIYMRKHLGARVGKYWKILTGSTGDFELLDNAMPTIKKKTLADGAKITAPGGIDLNPAQMNMQVNKTGKNFKFRWQGQTIDPIQVTGASFTIRTLTPVIDLPQILGLNLNTADAPDQTTLAKV